MDSRSQLTVDVIAKVTQGKVSINSTSKLLNKSRRTIELYLHRYRREGIRFVVHGNKGREFVNKTPDSLKRQVQQLIQTKYFDFNLSIPLYISLSIASIDNEMLSITLFQLVSGKRRVSITKSSLLTAYFVH